MDAAQRPIFAELMRHYRLTAGLSQQALAERARLSVEAISVLERGRRGAPRPDTVQLLADALGLDPTARRAFIDAALAPRIRTGSPPSPSPASVIPTPSAPAALSDPATAVLPVPVQPAALPLALTSLVGREREVAAVVHHLRYHQGRLLTLTGPGGVGKTRLALAVAAAQSDFADGVAFIPLAEIADAALVESVVAQALGLRQTGGQSVHEVLTAHLAAKQLLLVLDNFEHVLAAAPFFTNLLSACPRVVMLVTSQAALRVQAEQLFPVPSLAVPPTTAATSDGAAAYPAIQLFVERARAIEPEFTLSPTNTAALVEICRRLDGLPLAIELVAARVRVLSPPALLARLDHRLTIATGGARDLPVRHQALRATLDWSVALLLAEDRHVFERLAAFAGGATLEAIESICNPDESLDVLGSMTALIRQSLVFRQSPSAEAGYTGNAADGERYTMLQTIREYAEDLLAAGAESASIRQRHAAYFLDLAVETWMPADPAQRRWRVARLKVEQDNLRAALTWLLAHNDAGALRLAAAMGRFWRDGGSYAEGRQHLAAALASASREYAARVHATYWAAELAYAQGDVAAALWLAEDALRLARESGDDALLALSLREVGLRRYEAGEPDLGRELLAESLRHARQAGDVEMLASTLCACAAVQLAEEDAVAARPYVEEGLSLYRGLNDDLAVAYALELRGRMLLMSEEVAPARASLRESLLIRREGGNKAQVAACLELFAALLYPGGDMDRDRALQLLGAAETLRTQGAAPVPPIERAFYERTVNRARALRDADGARAVWARGLTLSVDEATALALAATE